jgi:1-acyl-sn-glycerol-3-phosphate acyltransferase
MLQTRSLQQTDESETKRYDHAVFARRRRILRFLLKWIGFTLLAKMDHVEGIENLPTDGPAILIFNHIAFIDSIVLLHVVPRYIVPLAKIEVYDYPIVGIFPKLWGVIPVRREEFDRRAVQQALQVLKAGEIVMLAPEATRGTELRQGKEGVAYLASRSGSPVIPAAMEGTKGFPALRGSAIWHSRGAVVRFGKPFIFDPAFQHARGDQLRKMTDEAMYVLAGMLPEERRGYYADLSKATRSTITWS